MSSKTKPATTPEAKALTAASENAKAVKPVAKKAEPVKAVKPVAKKTEPVKAVKAVAKKAEPVKAVKAVAKKAEPVKAVKPVVKKTEPVKAVKAVAKKAEPVKPVVKKTEPVKAVKSVAKKAEPVRVEKPVAKKTEPVKAVKSVAKKAEPVKVEKPVAKKAESVKVGKPVAKKAEPVKAVKPAVKKVEPVKVEKPVAKKVEPVKVEKTVTKKAESVKVEKPVAKKAEPVKAVKPAAKKVEPVKVEKPVTKKAEPVKVEKPVAKKVEPVKVEKPVAKKAEPVKVEKPVAKKAEPVKVEKPVTKKAEPVKVEKPVAIKAEDVSAAKQKAGAAASEVVPVSRTAQKAVSHLEPLRKLKKNSEDDAELIALRLVLARRKEEAARIRAEEERAEKARMEALAKTPFPDDTPGLPDLGDIDDRAAYKYKASKEEITSSRSGSTAKTIAKTPDGKPILNLAASKNDTMKVYMQDIGQISLVSKNEEVSLAAAIHSEDLGAHDTARATLIQANLRLVVKIAHDFKGLGLPLLDLISEGNIGLMRAVEKFDPAKGAKFSSYAAWWIKQSMRRALANQSRTIRIPVQSAGKINKIKSVRMKLAEKLGREPTDAEIAEHLEFSERTVAGLRLADLKTFSLHDPIQQGEDGEFQDIIPDKGAQTPDRILGDVESIHRLMDLLQDLEERERMILTMRFGLDGSPPRTLEEVSQEIGRTRERVRQIQNQALCKLRAMLADEADFTND